MTDTSTKTLRDIADKMKDKPILDIPIETLVKATEVIDYLAGMLEEKHHASVESLLVAYEANAITCHRTFERLRMISDLTQKTLGMNWLQDSDPTELNSDVADARRLRWLLSGNGYFLEEHSLCGHGPCDEDEMNGARIEIDRAMRRTAKR